MQKNPILLQVAMEIEGQEILKKIENKKEKEIFGYQFYEGILYGYPIVLSISKVGLIETTSSLTVAITTYQPIAVINFGIAGATAKDLHLKDIIVGTHCININSYRTAKRREQEGSNPDNWELLTFLSGEEDRLIEQPATKDLINLTKTFPSPFSIYYGKIGSGDVWNQEIDRLLYLNQKYQILCEDMESIATYTLCNKHNILVVSIKMISDNSITQEEYNREVGIDLQAYILKYLKEFILQKQMIKNTN